MVGEHSVGSDKMLTGDEQLDPEVVALCEALNTLPGIETVSSCCGHGQRPYRIWFIVTPQKGQSGQWMIEGPVEGIATYTQAAFLARALAGEQKP